MWQSSGLEALWWPWVCLNSGGKAVLAGKNLQCVAVRVDTHSSSVDSLVRLSCYAAQRVTSRPAARRVGTTGARRLQPRCSDNLPGMVVRERAKDGGQAVDLALLAVYRSKVCVRWLQETSVRERNWWGK
jgi:hypothetical protein